VLTAHDIFGRVHIPSAVIMELRDPQAPSAVRAVFASLPSWIVVQDPTVMMSLPKLHPGESAAISLAVEMQARLVIDERDGRKQAEQLGLEVIGSIRVIETAADHGLISDLVEVHERIRRTHFRVANDILKLSLARHLANRALQKDSTVTP
jgi:predicted nucleic acid-binding protein